MSGSDIKIVPGLSFARRKAGFDFLRQFQDKHSAQVSFHKHSHVGFSRAIYAGIVDISAKNRIPPGMCRGEADVCAYVHCGHLSQKCQRHFRQKQRHASSHTFDLQRAFAGMCGSTR
eukprot:2884082-Rhodomonas_salina.9